MTIGTRLKEWRVYKRLNQADISSLLGIPFSTLQKYEMDISKPGADAIIRFIDAGISATWLLKGIGPMLIADYSTKPVESTRAPVERELTTEEELAKSPLNVERLQRAITEIEDTLRSRGKRLDPEDKAQIVAMTYVILEDADKEKERASALYVQKIMKLIDSTF